MLWNFTFRFILQQYAPIIIACGINLYGLKFDTFDGKSASSIISLILMVFSILILFVMTNIIKKHRAAGKNESEEF
jgi:hypothetical protein